MAKRKVKKVVTVASELQTTTNGQFLSEKGPHRAYVSRKRSLKDLQMTQTEKVQLCAVLAVAIFTRIWHISSPDSVVFDEAAVGDAINAYLRRSFVLDQDPPAVKLIYTWISTLLRYIAPVFEFAVGTPYNGRFPYVALRVVSSLFGAGLSFTIYQTARASGVRHFVALFGAFLVAIENSFVEQTRFFFLDGPYLFFVGFAVAMIKSEENLRLLSRRWLRTLLLSGVALGVAVSSRLFGIFVLCWALVIAAKQVWYLFGDLKVTTSTAVKVGVAKLAAILAIPFSIYFFFFFVHLNILTVRGPGYGKMSPEFERSLSGNHLSNLVEEVSYGSTAMFRNWNSGKYLHSYNGTYQNGHQQVTLVDNFQDPENLWTIERNVKAVGSELTEKLGRINGGHKLRLFHQGTKTFLRVDPESKPALSEQDYNKEVNALGNESWTGDLWVNFEMRIARDYCKSEDAKETVLAVETVFQLYNPQQSCYLLGTEKTLPQDWGNGQTEVICIESPKLEKSLWYIDYNTHPLFSKNFKTVDIKKLSPFDKFVEVNKAMLKLFTMNTNEHRYMSGPADWISTSKGIPYFIGNNQAIYFTGNLIVYYLTAFCAVGFVLWEIARAVTWNPFATESSLDFNSRTYDFEFHSLDYFLGYVINLAPFFLMEQTLFQFYYLPALYFGILLICQTFELIVAKRSSLGYIFMAVWGAAAILNYLKFSPLLYALHWTRRACEEIQVSPSWKGMCSAFH